MFKLEPYLFVCLLFVGWTWAQETTAPDVQVIPVYEGQLAFIEALQANPELSLIEKTERYQELALAPYVDDCAAGDEEAYLQSNSGYEVTDLETWKVALQELAAADLAGAVEEGVTKSTSLLSADPITFCVFALHPKDSFVIDRMGGVVGSTLSDTTVYLVTYPVAGWLEWVALTVAHEYHHAAWMQRFPNGFDDFRLTDYLVFEGKADSFAKLVYPNLAAPWTKALSPEQEREQWEALQPHLKTRNVGFQGQIMFGGERYPTWTGYTIGFNIVQAFLENSDMTVETWTELDAPELLERSGYAP